MKYLLPGKIMRLILLGMISFNAFAESFEFVDRDITEILYAVSIFKGFSVCADDTVRGKGDFRLSGDDFDLAFDSFLLRSRLYVKKEEKVWTVSRCRFERNEDGLFKLDCCDMTMLQILEKAGVETGICVTYDSLPGNTVNIHTGFCEGRELIERIAALASGFEAVNKKDGVIHVGRIVRSEAPVTGRVSFSEFDGMWNADVQNSVLSVVVERLCGDGKRQFCIISGGDGKIVRACFKGKCFDETLELLCAQAGAEVVKSGEVYCIVQSKEAKKKIDRAGKEWICVCLENLKGEDFVNALSKRFEGVEIVPADKSGNFLLCADKDKTREIEEFVKLMDKKKETFLIPLKYLQPVEFFSALPPYIEKSKVSDCGRSDCFCFTGSKAEYERLMAELSEYDRPKPRVSYDLLIIQYQDSEAARFIPSAGIAKSGDQEEGSFSAQLGTVLDFNMDITSAFGLKFAAGLQASINKTKARVFADTTLTGVSGCSIGFQNTNTYRYRDNNLDPDTGKPVYSGVTREIISGLKLEITGTVTGDGMITTKITASVSRQGADTSSNTGNPPPSSEKVVSTEVRARSGEPVVLSGLVQEEENKTESRTPLISKLPVVGHLFRGVNKEREKTELVIYLVPSTEMEVINKGKESETDYSAEMKRVLKEFNINA